MFHDSCFMKPKGFFMIQLPTLREMVEAGAHFGHKTSRRHPKMEEYIFMAKSGVHVINLEKTLQELQKAVEFVSKEAALGKVFAFVGTKKQSSEIIKQAALECGMPYVNIRWLGGTITNFDVVKTAARKFKADREELLLAESGGKTGLSKSEISKLRKNVVHGEKFLGGLVDMTKKPDGLILFGSHDEKIALHEATLSKIPVIAIVDTNADPSLVQYPIPANDDATKSVSIFAGVFAKAILEGKSQTAKVEK